MTQPDSERTNSTYLRGTTDCMLERLEPYEESVRKYFSLRAGGAQPSELTTIEIEMNERRKHVQDYQGEANGWVRSATIRELEFISTQGLNRVLRHLDRCLGKLPTDLALPPEYDQPFQFWRKYLENIRVEITDVLSDRAEPEPQASEAQQHAARVASQVQAYLETVRLLEERCEEDIRHHPAEEAQIRRRYRKAIDALKDKT